MRKRKVHIEFVTKTIVKFTTPFKQRKIDISDLHFKVDVPQEFGPPKIKKVPTNMIDLVTLEPLEDANNSAFVAQLASKPHTAKDGGTYYEKYLSIRAKSNADNMFESIGEGSMGCFLEYYPQGVIALKGVHHTFEVTIP